MRFDRMCFAGSSRRRFTQRGMDRDANDDAEQWTVLQG